jgi:hypothetical protein
MPTLHWPLLLMPVSTFFFPTSLHAPTQAQAPFMAEISCRFSPAPSSIDGLLIVLEAHLLRCCFARSRPVYISTSVPESRVSRQSHPAVQQNPTKCSAPRFRRCHRRSPRNSTDSTKNGNPRPQSLVSIVCRSLATGRPRAGTALGRPSAFYKLFLVALCIKVLPSKGASVLSHISPTPLRFVGTPGGAAHELDVSKRQPGLRSIWHAHITQVQKVVLPPPPSSIYDFATPEASSRATTGGFCLS